MVNEQIEIKSDSISQNIENQNHPSADSEGKNFAIQVKGHLNASWSDWLEGMEMRLLDNGEMILSGYIVDQAALMGVLNKLVRLNLKLMSVNEINKKD